MARDGQKLLGFVVGIAAIGLVLAVFGQRVLGLAAGPETEIITALKKAERGVEWPVGAYGTLVGAKLQYQRLQITLGPGGQTAIATGTLDFEGVFDARTKVSSLTPMRTASQSPSHGFFFVGLLLKSTQG